MVIARSNVTLKCTVETDPEEMDQLRVDWLKDGIPIDFTAELGHVFHNPGDNSLTISISSVLDSGAYTCNASNGIDSDRYTVDVTIKGEYC